jgi:hypothetical protein
MLSHDWLCSGDAPWRIVLRGHWVLILLVGRGRHVSKRILVMVCLDGYVGMRGWKAVKVIDVAVREERVAW